MVSSPPAFGNMVLSMKVCLWVCSDCYGLEDPLRCVDLGEAAECSECFLQVSAIVVDNCVANEGKSSCSCWEEQGYPEAACKQHPSEQGRMDWQPPHKVQLQEPKLTFPALQTKLALAHRKAYMNSRMHHADEVLISLLPSLVMEVSAPLSPSDIKHCQDWFHQSHNAASESWHLISLGLLRSSRELSNFMWSNRKKQLQVWHLHMLWSNASMRKINFSDSKRLFLSKTQKMEVFPEYVFLNHSMDSGESQ